MDLVGIVLLILALALVGFLVHLITTKIPMDDTIKQVIIVVIVIAVVLYCLGLITGHTGLPSLRGVR
jgi:VIT1/CCC1 family predicted Fe2+/Mn2+ transporter